jgi:membrane protein
MRRPRGDRRHRSAAKPNTVDATEHRASAQEVRVGDILLRVYNNIGKDRIITIAAGVTFYSLLAMFPAIAAMW